MTLDDLRKIAENATAGEWRCETYVSVDGRVHLVKADGCQHVLSSLNMSEEDAEFIATFNPQRVLELLDQTEQLQAVVRDQHDNCTYQTRLAAVEKLHTPVEVEPSDTICGHCSFQLPNGKYFGKIVEYPCDTIKAVRGE